MQPRRRIGIVTLIVMGLAIGLFLKNVKIGLIIGLILGISAGNLIGGSRRRR